ncbi:MAG: glycosyltransferase family 4 protein [Archangium sp.]|nr:glycosyltransferase family 4 protein [Archangium sp.]
MTPCLVPGDAVSNDVVGMEAVLAARGHEVAIFADNWAPAPVSVRHVNEIGSFLQDPSAVLIYHYSVGWDIGLRLLNERPCKTVVKYHNVTPPAFFEGVNEDYAAVCRHGRQQLAAIATAGCDLYLSDSEYNARELAEAGTGSTPNLVVPPFHHIDRLFGVEADLGIIDRYRDGRANVLMVGRLAPNKRHDRLIEAFAHYFHGYNRQARLLIVGKEDDRLSGYTNALRRQVKRLRLQDAVVFCGAVSDAALKSYYLLADAFLLTSDHEGFCVPLVESMAMKVPIVAYAAAAIPETVGNAGLVWAEPGPEVLAASLSHLIQDEETRRACSQAGWVRYHQRFTNEQIEANFARVMKDTLGDADGAFSLESANVGSIPRELGGPVEAA